MKPVKLTSLMMMLLLAANVAAQEEFFDDVYFSSEKGAKCAIEEVVEPFMKEHPEFVW